MAMSASSASFRVDAGIVRPADERAAVATVALAAMLAPLNSTMIAVALPGLMAEFGAGMASAGWLVTGYLIAMAALQPVAGKLGDRLGRRGMILGGVAAFGAASLGAATASGLSALVVFRVLQAAAGAVAFPNGAALIREVVPPDRRARRFGLVGAAMALAAAAGPPIGGWLVGIAGWRAIFLVNLLLVVPALGLGWGGLPAGSRRRGHASFDLFGALLLLLGLLAASALLIHGSTCPPGLGLLVVLALATLAAIFLSREFRHPDPVLQPRLFGHRGFAAANAAVALSNLAMYATLFAVPILLARRAGWESADVGLALAAMSVGMAAFSPIGGRLADRSGRRGPTVAGLSLLTIGLLPLALRGGEVTGLALLGGLVLAGAGIGLSASGLQTSAIESVGPAESGVASGLFSTSRYLGSIVGSSVLAGQLGPTASGAEAFGAVFAIAAGAALLSTLASARLPAATPRGMAEPASSSPR
jgi:EmrB/QacA subfamily drug resistance transporter